MRQRRVEHLAPGGPRADDGVARADLVDAREPAHVEADAAGEGLSVGRVARAARHDLQARRGGLAHGGGDLLRGPRTDDPRRRPLDHAAEVAHA
nr:hypothetical protein [Actinomadura terrae]